jgi:iron complex outermembrane receptor protein
MGITDTTIPPMNFYTNGTRVYTNVPNAKMYNANIQMQYSPLTEFSLFLLTKYTWGQLYSGEPLPLIAPLNNVLAICYQKSGWNFRLENETALAQNRINTDFGELKSPSYTVFNIKASRHFMFLKPVMLDCSLAVTNLFNAIYYEHLDWGQINRPGRSIDFLVKFSF